MIKDGSKRSVSAPALLAMQAAMQGLTNLSMRWLNYPAKMLFKSSRVIPTMLVRPGLDREDMGVMMMMMMMMMMMARMQRAERTNVQGNKAKEDEDMRE
jgi:hypothetical protein